MARHPVSLVLRQLRSLIGGRGPKDWSDAQLVERFAHGQDEAAFETLIERYGPLVLGLCRRLLHDDHDAEDAFQATFLVLARKAGSIRRSESVGSWLYGVAYRTALEARGKSARRRRHERQAGEMKLENEALELTELFSADSDLHPILDEELRRLPEKYRAPLILCFLQGKTNEEAAQELRWPVGSVKGRLHRAKELLRSRLARRGVAVSSALLAVLLSGQALAAVPTRLAQSTLHHSLLFAAGQAVAGGSASLAEGVLHAMFITRMKKLVSLALGCLLLIGSGLGALAYHLADAPRQDPPVLVKSAKSGPWSSPDTWQGGKLPAAGNKVQVRTGHTITYDINSDTPIRMVHVAGTLTFAPDKDTRLDVGLIKIQAGDDCSEDGFDCDAHIEAPSANAERPALLVGTPEKPIDAKHRALIRLMYFEGMNKESNPAIVCCGGRMDFHGAVLSRTWVKLGDTARKGESFVTLADPVTGWKVGDRIIITASSHNSGYKGWHPNTIERTIKEIDGVKLVIDEPLENDHLGNGDFRAEVANLSRNVVVESADPAGVRGHTMYHRYSAGSLSYSEFRHLGKKDTLGRYTLHFHLIGDTMRGSYVVGNSIHDSHNRWLTIHGTNYLVVRDNVGYKSIGHGFFLEDGTEVYNVLDRNLAVNAQHGKRLPKQVLPFDANEGAGYWWANSLNTFTRNVATECDLYGFRFEATPSSALKLNFPVLQPDGTRKIVDIRTLPFVRFDDNEVHSNIGLYGVNLGEGVNRVGPDARHPFIVRNLKIWDTHYGFRPQVPSLLAENTMIHKVAYGVYHPNYDNHVYKNLTISQTNTEPFNRGHDDLSVQYGSLVVDGLTFDGIRSGGMPLIQISDDNPTGAATSHFRNVKLENWKDGSKARALVNLGGGPRPTPKTETSVPVYVHDWFGPGRHAMVVSVKSGEFKADPGKYKAVPNLTGDESRAVEVSNVDFPKLLDPVDDLPPTTVITQIKKNGGKLVVRGTAADNGTITKVLVNGQEAKPLSANFAEWQIELDSATEVKAHAADAAGNVEKLVHTVPVK